MCCWSRMNVPPAQPQPHAASGRTDAYAAYGAAYGGSYGGSSASRFLPHEQPRAGAAGVEEDSLRHDINSYLRRSEHATEEETLEGLTGIVCYSRPADFQEDRWREARAVGSTSKTEGPSNGQAEGAAWKVFGEPPRSSSVRWPARPVACDFEEDRGGPMRGACTGMSSRRPRTPPKSDYRGGDTSESGDSAESCGYAAPPPQRGGASRGREAGGGAAAPRIVGRCTPQAVKTEELLEFSSCFESANLRYAVYNPEESAYDLVLEYDVHTHGHTQWFYFAVRNGALGKSVRLRVVNLSKAKSLFSLGMTPVAWSEAKAAEQCGAGGLNAGPAASELWAGAASQLWCHVGKAVGYGRSRTSRGASNRFYTLSFEYTFEYEGDCVFFAYCVPYTYTMLRTSLMAITRAPHLKAWCKLRNLCPTLGDVRCDLLEISNWELPSRHKKAIIISARVHPGETNASWLMQGLIGFLLTGGPDAQVLRDNFIWQFVPMLNPDGVICGNYRCGLSGVDLNRQWRQPCEALHGTVHWIKRLIVRSKKKKRLSMYVDIHGHSRRCGVFSYACAKFPKDDYRRFTVRMFPKLLSLLSPDFALGSCRWRMGRGKRGTGRVVVAKDLGLTYTYTVEASFFGAVPVGWQDEGDRLSRIGSAPEARKPEKVEEREDDAEEKDEEEDVEDVVMEDAVQERKDEYSEVEEMPEIVVFTPQRLEEFGAVLARACLLHQNLGPLAQRRMQKQERDGTLDTRKWPPLNMATLAARDDHGARAATAASTAAGASSSPPESGASTASGVASDHEDGDQGRAHDDGGSSSASPLSPSSRLRGRDRHRLPASCPGESPPSASRSSSPTAPEPKAEASALVVPSASSLSGGGSAAALGADPRAAACAQRTPLGLVADLADACYMGIDMGEVLRDLETEPVLSSSGPESAGSASDPSEDNLNAHDLGHVGLLLSRGAPAQQPPSPRRRARRRHGSTRRQGAHGEASKVKIRAPTRSKDDGRGLGGDGSQARASPTVSKAPVARPPEMQRVVAFGGTTYVSPSLGASGGTSCEPVSPARRSTSSGFSMASSASSTASAPAPPRHMSPPSSASNPFYLAATAASTAVPAGGSEAKVGAWPPISQAAETASASLSSAASALGSGASCSSSSAAGKNARHSAEAAISFGGPPRERFNLTPPSSAGINGLGNSSSSGAVLGLGVAAGLPPTGRLLHNSGGRFSEDNFTRRHYVRSVSTSLLHRRFSYSAPGPGPEGAPAVATLAEWPRPGRGAGAGSGSSSMPRSSSRPTTAGPLAAGATGSSSLASGSQSLLDAQDVLRHEFLFKQR